MRECRFEDAVLALRYRTAPRKRPSSNSLSNKLAAAEQEEIHRTL